MDTARRFRGVSPLISVILMVAVTVIIGAVLAVGAMTLLPSDGDLSVRPDADFTFDRDDGDIVVTPTYMTEGVEFDLLINGVDAYTWTGGRGATEQPLSCLNEGDEVYIRADTQGDRTFSIEDHEVRAPTKCELSGTGAQFAYARVGNRKMPLEGSGYEFTLSIDPDGPNAINGDTDYPSSNPWVYVQRYEKELEGLTPPVYVVVFPDNVDSGWGTEPSDSDRQEMTNTYEVNGNSVTPTPSGIEPTEDVYLLFKPGCDGSTLEFLEMDGSYNNQILLDGEELFRTDSATTGEEYDVPGVTCT